MKNYLILFFFLLTTFGQIHAQVSCGDQNTTFIQSWSVPEQINNICGENGTLDYSVDMFFFEDDAAESRTIEVKLRYWPGDLFIVKDVTGADSHTISSPPNAYEEITAIVTINGSGIPNQITEHNLTIKFYISDYLTFSTDNIYHNLKVVGSTDFCYDDLTELTTDGIINTQLGGNTVYYNVVESPNNILSMRTSNPAPNSTTGSFQVVDFFDIDVDFDVDGNSNSPDKVWLCDDAEMIISAQDEVTFEDYDFSSMTEFNTISVKDGATLKLTNCTISNAVQGVTVESGGTLILDGVNISSCSQSGVMALDGSTLHIEHSTFSDNRNGLVINGNANIVVFDDNNFNDNANGVLVKNTTSVINLESTNRSFFNNNKRGVVVSSANASIAKNDFNDNLKGIALRQTEILQIQDNIIQGSATSISGDFCNFYALENTISNCDIGFRIVASDDYGIYNNDIDANNYATVIHLASGEIDNNRIGQNDNMDRGLHQIFTTDQIQDNIISTSHTNILANSLFDSSIDHNDLLDGDHGVFSVGGTTETFVELNVIETNISGVLYNNSGMNTTGCNEIESDEAIWVRGNSDLQDLIANSLDGSENDVLIQSELGTQEHNGNVFIGESITANGLSQNEILGSVFIVDPSNPDFVPNNPNPQELVELQSFFGTPKNCDGLAGSRMKQRFLDPVIMCKYLQKIEAYKLSNPPYYWNRMYHLMRYYLLEIPVGQWPNCINLAWNNENMCGLKTLVENEVKIKQLLLNSQSATGLKSSFGVLKSAQTSEINGLECTLPITSIWKDVYLLMLKRINGDALNEQDQYTLENAATKCASEYGDAVHWARSLLSEYNNTDYYVYDNNCTISTQSLIQTQPLTPYAKDVYKTDDLSFTAFPNPVSDVLTISSDYSDFLYTLSDTNGKIMLEGQIKSQLIKLDVQYLLPGIYTLALIQSNGERDVRRIIIVD